MDFVASLSFDPLFWAAALFAILLAGLSKGGFGAGGSFAGIPLLAVVVGPVEAAALMLPVLITMDLVGLRAYWGKWSWSVSWPLMVTCILGVGVGALTFGMVSDAWLSVLLGVITLSLLAYRYLSAWLIRRLSGGADEAEQGSRTNWWKANCWGTAAGFTSFVIHAGGPPAMLYLTSFKLEKTVYQATTVLFFTWLNAIKLIPYFALGLFTGSNLAQSAVLLPFAIAAMLLGVWAHNRINQRLFYAVVYAGAILAALRLIWDGVNSAL